MRYDVFSIQEGKGEQKYWVNIGAAFPNKDNSINLKLNFLPLNGNMDIQLRIHEENTESGVIKE